MAREAPHRPHLSNVVGLHWTWSFREVPASCSGGRSPLCVSPGRFGGAGQGAQASRPPLYGNQRQAEHRRDLVAVIDDGDLLRPAQVQYMVAGGKR